MKTNNRLVLFDDLPVTPALAAYRRVAEAGVRQVAVVDMPALTAWRAALAASIGRA